MQVDLLDRPGVLDRVAEPVVEDAGTASAAGSGPCRDRGACAGFPAVAGTGRCDYCGGGRGHWQASQVSGFSREQARAAASARSSARHGDRDRDGRLLDPGRGPRAQVVGGLQAALPGVAGTSRRACRWSGAAMNRFSDWLWSMNGARAAAMSISARCGSSHAVRNSRWSSSGSAVDALHRALGPLDLPRGPRASTARGPSARATSAVLICRNSPDRVSRLNRLDTCGSMHS